MKWRIKSKSGTFFLWLVFLVVIPLILFYIFYGEFNLANKSWVISKNQATPIFYYPLEQKNFDKEWKIWVETLNPVYHKYFLNLGLQEDTLVFYNNGHLMENNNLAKASFGVVFRFPYSHIESISVLWIFLILIINVLILITYHLILKWKSKDFWITTEAYPFLFAIWFGFVILFYSGGLYGVNKEDDNHTWYIVISRLVFVSLGTFLAFFLGFRINNHFNRYYHDLNYYEEIKKFKEDGDLQKQKKVSYKKDKRKIIKIERD